MDFENAKKEAFAAAVQFFHDEHADFADQLEVWETEAFTEFESMAENDIPASCVGASLVEALESLARLALLQHAQFWQGIIADLPAERLDGDADFV